MKRSSCVVAWFRNFISLMHALVGVGQCMLAILFRTCPWAVFEFRLNAMLALTVRFIGM